MALVHYNPDTRMMHRIPGGIRIFGRIPGHKLRGQDPFQKDKSPTRVDETKRKTIHDKY